MKKEKKAFRLFDSVLMAVVVILVVEAAAPAAAIGNSQFFWWILLFGLFFVPYGLVSAELGTTYEDNGGMYDWVKRAFGKGMGTRVAWYYWINFPLWMASLAVLCSSVVSQLLELELSSFQSLLIEISFLVIVVLGGTLSINIRKWMLNVAAIFKVFIIVSLGIMALYIGLTKGAVNTYELSSFLPDFDFNSVSFVSVIIFNFLGFEVVTAVSKEMPNPKKQIPKAIILGGVLIMFFYALSAFGIGVAVPIEELSLSNGLLDSYALLLGNGHPVFFMIIGVMFLLTLFANLISWSLGINYVVSYAAKDHSLPRVFAIESKKTGEPIGASWMNLIVSVAMIVLSHLISNQDFFWNFFALNMITLLLSYVFLFPAFIKLRSSDPNQPRVFKVPGKKVFPTLVAYVPMVLLLLSVIFSVVPFSLDSEELAFKGPLLLGTVVAVVIGEILVISSKKSRSKKQLSKAA